jgi:hypothetical protein
MVYVFNPPCCAINTVGGITGGRMSRRQFAALGGGASEELGGPMRKALIFAAATLIASAANAAPITYNFSGFIALPGNSLGLISNPVGTVSPGDQFSGSLTFDTLAPDTSPDPFLGNYAIEAFSITIGGETASIGPVAGAMEVLDAGPGDLQDTISINIHVSPGPVVGTIARARLAERQWSRSGST